MTPHALLANAEKVYCVNCEDGPGLVEIVGAAAGVLGGVAAVLALALARASAKQAKRSATAAEETAIAAKRTAVAAEEVAELTREQVVAWREERGRRAEIEAELTIPFDDQVTGAMGPPLGTYGFRLGLRNVGDRAVDRVTLNLVVPVGVGMSSRREGMSVIQHESIAEADAVDLGRGDEPGSYWNAVLGPLDPGNSYVIDHLVLLVPERETPVLLSINHPDKPGDVYHRWVIAYGSDSPVRRIDELDR